MMVESFNDRKYKLIEEIIDLKSENQLDEIEKSISRMKLNGNDKIFREIRKNISVKELVEEQSFISFDRKAFDKLIEELEIEEPFEKLMQMLD